MMKIAGETRPITNKDYVYTLITDAGKPVAVLDWKVEHSGGLSQSNSHGKFKFGTPMSGKTVKLTARTRVKEVIVGYSVTLVVLAGIPKILSLKWQDQHGRDIQKGTPVGYLDKIQLLIKTQNIPVGDTLSVTIYEDQYQDGHAASSRDMGTSVTSGVNKNGDAYLYFNNIKLYQDKLNKEDMYDEDEHEYYAQVVYRSHFKRIEDGIQIKIKNEEKQYIKPPVSNKPVVVKKPDTAPKKEDKKKVNVTFNMFFDGTMNNMTNTKSRVEPDYKLIGVYDKISNKKDDSYVNFYSNVALLYMNNVVNIAEDIISIYTEGIGTVDKQKDQMLPGGVGSSIDIPMPGTPIVVKLYPTGVKDKVARGIAQMLSHSKVKYSKSKSELGKITINVFGFSRGAAAARYFMSQESKIVSALKLESKKDIKFNFVGVFDTVAAYGVYHKNDVSELNLDIGSKAKKVVHLAAADEYRDNFKLTDITSSIKAGVGYELTMPGVHSDVGGGYPENDSETRILKEDGVFENYSLDNKKEIEAQHLILRKKYVEQGWYRADQLFAQKVGIQDAGNGKSYYKLQLVGKRIFVNQFKDERIPNTYQFIAFAIMKTFCEKYAKMLFADDKQNKYGVSKDLESVKKQLYNYAIANDGINSLKVTLSHEQLMRVRNKYLHRSTNDFGFGMAGRYDDNGNPNRDVMEG